MTIIDNEETSTLQELKDDGFMVSMFCIWSDHLGSNGLAK